MHKISLCVTSFKRPETLLQLIHSYQKQDYKNKEMVISDDTPDDSIRNLIKELRDKSIKYFHNDPGLGFSQNYWKAIERGTGDYLVTIGDDDLLMDKHVLSDYVKIFDANPTVGFIYSSQIQFSDKLQIQYEITFTAENKKFKKGRESMENMWVRSIFIGGIGIRNNKNLKRWYPTKKILHPQVEFIGHIINHYDSYLLARNHIGFRSHGEQLIFHALKDKKVKAEGNHMTLELYDIFNKLNKEYKLQMNFDFVAQELVRQQMVMMFKEKSFLGNKEMEKNYRKFCELSPVAKNSTKFKIGFFLAKMLPANVILSGREMALRLISTQKKDEYKKWEKQLLFMIRK